MCRSHMSVRKWAAEVASRGKFASALPPEQAASNPGSLPVPCLVINNKADLRGAAPHPFPLATLFAALYLKDCTQKRKT